MYLGAYISKSGGTEEDIKARLGKARAAYSKLDKIWKNSQFTYKTKIKISKSYVISVLLYGCKCWRMTKTDEKKLEAFLYKSLRWMFKICWPMRRVTNEEIRARAGLETISKQMARRRWTWLGHVLRMDYHSHPRIALTWVPEGKRKRVRPRETWRMTYRKRAERERFRNMGSSSIGCGGENSLEAKSLRPNSLLGEWINDDYDLYHEAEVHT